jgi:hypothetical protein
MNTILSVETPVLLSTEGKVASTLLKDGRWGSYWVLDDWAAKEYGKRFFHPSKSQSPEKARLFNASKGFKLATARVMANKRGQPDVRSLINHDFEVVA